MSSGFHRLGCNVVGKVTGYHAANLPIGVLANGMIAAPPPVSLPSTVADTLLAVEAAPRPSRAAAQQQGYTGDQCSACNSMRMQIAGHCMVCADCGTTTGCS